MRFLLLIPIVIVVMVIGAVIPLFVKISYLYFAGYIVLMYIALASAWNILGGYAGYVNFGTSGFFGLAAYLSAFLLQTVGVSLPIALLASGAISAALGLGIGYSTLKLRGIFFAIATLAVAIVIQMIIINTPAVGGAVGFYTFRPSPPPPYTNYLEFLFVVMLAIALASVLTSRAIEKSKIGRGLVALRDDETAAECMGVPVFKLKLLAAGISGFFMGLAGAPYPYYITYMEPISVFSLDISVNAVAMPLVGGLGTWTGPLIGAAIVAAIQQAVTVTIGSELNLVIIGVLLVAFVVAAPYGIVGLIRERLRRLS